MMVKYLSRKFKISCTIIDNQSNNLKKIHVKNDKKLKDHYNICGSIKELIHYKNYKKNTVYITGQHADTLYYIDTFAPNTYQIKFERFFNIFKTIHLRFFYSNIFLKIITNNFFLKILKINKEKFLKEKIKSLISSEKEHVSWFYKSKKIK